MMKIILVGVGGFFGAISRFGVAQLVRYLFPSAVFPIGTLVINFAGCVGIGFLYAFFKDHQILPTLTLFAIIGFLGAFTTFSTFSFETVELLKRDQLSVAVVNILASVVLCLVGVIVGEWLGRIM